MCCCIDNVSLHWEERITLFHSQSGHCILHYCRFRFPFFNIYIYFFSSEIFEMGRVLLWCWRCDFLLDYYTDVYVIWKKDIIYKDVIHTEVIYKNVIYKDVIYNDVIYNDVIYENVIYNDVIYENVIYENVIYKHVQCNLWKCNL
jgi:hypothetical protein